MVSEERAKEIISVYGRAWEEQDVELVLTIFSEDAEYHERAFERPFVGHEEIAGYWRSKVCEEQSDISFKPLHVYVCGETIIAEWESWFDSGVKRARVHLKEVAILEVKDGLVRSLREYWQSEKSSLD